MHAKEQKFLPMKAHDRHEGRLAGTGILGEKTLNQDVDAFRQAHFLVLQHTTEVSPYIDEHKVQLRR